MGGMISELDEWEGDSSTWQQRRNQQQDPSIPHVKPQYNQRQQQYPRLPYQQRQQQRQQPQRRHISSVSTPELLEYLEREFSSTVETFRNMRKENQLDDGGRSYIRDLMIDKEDRLRRFNNSMDPSRRTDADEELLRQRDFIKELQEENSRLNAEKKYLDRLLASSMREPSTRSSSHASPTSSGYSDNKDRGKEQKDESPSSRGRRGSHDKLVQDLQYQLGKCDDDIKTLSAANESNQSYIKHLSKRIEKLETENKKLQDEKEILAVSTPSTTAGDRHVDDSSVLTDINDPNQPRKLGEFYSEIYNHEWTHAFEALEEAGYKMETTVKILRLILQDVVKFCERDVRPFLGKTAEDLQRLLEQYRKSETIKKILNTDASQKDEDNAEACDMVPGRKKSTPDTNSKLEVMRKDIGAALVHLVLKDFHEARFGIEYVKHLKPFVVKCLKLGWMMVYQTLPIVLHEYPTEDGVRFDRDLYKEFTRPGPFVEFVVWPALLLHENGPVIVKGIAEGKKNHATDWHKKLYLQR